MRHNAMSALGQKRTSDRLQLLSQQWRDPRSNQRRVAKIFRTMDRVANGNVGASQVVRARSECRCVDKRHIALSNLAFADAGVEEDKKGGSRRAIQRQWAVDKAVASAFNDRCCHVRPLCPRDPSQV